MPDKKPGKGGTRKIGRGLRSPSHVRYTNERRWETNKARRIAKNAKREAKVRRRRVERIAK